MGLEAAVGEGAPGWEGGGVYLGRGGVSLGGFFWGGRWLLIDFSGLWRRKGLNGSGMG